MQVVENVRRNRPFEPLVSLHTFLRDAVSRSSSCKYDEFGAKRQPGSGKSGCKIEKDEPLCYFGETMQKGYLLARKALFAAFALLLFIAYYPCIHEHSCIGHGRIVEPVASDSDGDCPQCLFQEIPGSAGADQIILQCEFHLAQRTPPVTELVSTECVYFPGFPRPPPVF